MTTTRIKEKISSIVERQFPEFVQKDFIKFIAFVESYYKFLEQDQHPQEIIQNLQSYADIDRTSDAFVKYFLKNYARDIPESVLANKKLLIKKITDLYESKGSTLSYKLLFRLLFNEEVDVVFPYEFALIPSDGTWQQRNAIIVDTKFISSKLLTEDGLERDRTKLTNRLLLIIVDGVQFSIPILQINILTREGSQFGSGLTEIFLDKNFLPPVFTAGSTVTVEDALEGGDILFRGTIEQTTTTVSVDSGGSNFKNGDIYTIDINGGVDTIIKIQNVTSTGSISEVEIIDFGYGYTTNTSSTSFLVNIDPTGSTALPTSDRQITDNTLGFKEDGVIKHTGNSQVVATFGSNTSFSSSGTISAPNNEAIIKFTLGTLARYPGEFTTNKGFLSEPDFRLPDDLLYQPFAYQTVSGLDINNFKDVVLQLIHPAGQRLFNNRLLEGTIDVSANVSVFNRANLFLELEDVFTANDAPFGFIVSKEFGDTANVIDSGTLTLDSQNYFAVSSGISRYLESADPKSANSYIAGETVEF